MIPKHVWLAGPYEYTHTVRPYAYGPADHTCFGIIWVKLKKINNNQKFVALVLQDAIFTSDG